MLPIMGHAGGCRRGYQSAAAGGVGLPYQPAVLSHSTRMGPRALTDSYSRCAKRSKCAGIEVVTLYALCI